MKRTHRSTFKCWAFGLMILLMCAGSAGAMTISMTGLPSKAEVLGQVSFDVILDTGPGLTGVTLLSVGVLFADAQLGYRQDLSTTSSAILQGPGAKSAYMRPSPTCGGTPGLPGCSLWVGSTNQVNVDFISTDLIGGTDYPSDSPELLATLVFDVISVGDGFAEIELTLKGPGNVIGLAGGATWTSDLIGGGGVAVPEPTTALLVAAGLVGLGFSRRRA